ncbi:MAG: nitrilase-related carbon-nitrogen hydrolase [Thermoanaerobaculaceae bacterium]
MRIGMAIVSGALFYLALGLNPWWPAAWLAPMPALLACLAAPGKEARWLAWLAPAIGVCSNFTYYLKVTGPVATVVVMLLQVLMWGFLLLQARRAVFQSQRWFVVFYFPTLVAGLATLVSFFSPHGTWGGLVNSQMAATPIVQIASLLGAPAVVFTVMLFASAAAVALYRGRSVDHPWLAYGLPALLIVGTIGFGFVRLALAPEAATKVRVGLVSIDDLLGKKTSPTHVEEVWCGYEQSIAKLSEQGARIIVLPEKIQALTPEGALQRQHQMAEAARRSGVYLVVGTQINRDPGDLLGRKDNVSWLIDPAGDVLAEYLKQQMVPGLEGDLTPGHEDVVKFIVLSEAHEARFGLVICRDLVFTKLGRRYGKLGVTALLVPAWDFYRDAWMASSVAALRGVENGYAVIRAGREGYLNVSDRYGRVLARRRSDYYPGTSIIADVPVGQPEPTTYTKIGDVFGWLSVAAAAAVLVRRR